MHNTVGRGRGLMPAFGDFVGLNEGEEGTVRLGETLQPILNVFDIPEASYLRQERRFSGVVIQDAVALEQSFVGIRNHTGSGMLMIIEAFTISAAPASRMIFTVSLQSATGVATTTAVLPADTRWINSPGFVMPAGSGVARVGTDFDGQHTPAGGIASMKRPFVLHPGRELRAYHVDLNTQVIVCVAGRVRAMTPQEAILK